jgi:hypothetical protein
MSLYNKWPFHLGIHPKSIGECAADNSVQYPLVFLLDEVVSAVASSLMFVSAHFPNKCQLGKNIDEFKMTDVQMPEKFRLAGGPL